MCKHNRWNKNQVTCISNPNDLNKLRGMKLVKEDVYYGTSVEEFGATTIMELRRGIEYILKRSGLRKADPRRG